MSEVLARRSSLQGVAKTTASIPQSGLVPVVVSPYATNLQLQHGIDTILERRQLTLPDRLSLGGDTAFPSNQVDSGLLKRFPEAHQAITWPGTFKRSFNCRRMEDVWRSRAKQWKKMKKEREENERRNLCRNSTFFNRCDCFLFFSFYSTAPCPFSERVSSSAPSANQRRAARVERRGRTQSAPFASLPNSFQDLPVERAGEIVYAESLSRRVRQGSSGSQTWSGWTQGAGKTKSLGLFFISFLWHQLKYQCICGQRNHLAPDDFSKIIHVFTTLTQAVTK